MGTNSKANGSTEKLSFYKQVENATPGDSRLKNCIQCGTCAGSCPSSQDMDHTPRKIFGLIFAGMKDEVLESNTFWYCVSCYYCISRCPQEVHITDLMYTLKQMAIKEGTFKKSSAKSVPDFSETFMDYVKEYGRSFELGLATRYYLKNRPFDLFKSAGMGLGMILKGRFDITPPKIDDIDGLKAILAKAEELEAAS